MGILAEPLEFIRALPLVKGFAVCELGDQWVTAQQPHYLARDFYKRLGAGRYESIDGNGKGTITHDLNYPLSDTLTGKFDLVTDFGTGEHIFNQYQVWKSLHHLVKPGGFIAFDRPTKGYEGHCFYNTQEALFIALAHANRYTVIQFEHRETSRGELIRGVFRRQTGGKFQVPQQGRYFKSLVIDDRFSKRGPDYKSGVKRAMQHGT